MGRDRSQPDLTFVTLVHRALRADAERLVASVEVLEPGDRAARIGTLREYYACYREQLVAHHTHEDTLFFPALSVRVGEQRMHLGELTAQHHELDAVLQAAGERLAALQDPGADFGRSRDEAARTLSEMGERLRAHLDLEERTALPLYATNVPVDEYEHLEARARKATPRAQARFLIPWLAENATPEQRAAWFRSAPPLRALSLLHRRGYRRLAGALAPG
jgi:hemerythrin-like domain-containing protein